MANIPQHPARSGGLGSPTAQGNPNQYFAPNQALQAAQAQQANASANKAMTEAAMMQQVAQQQGLQGPTVTPQEVQARQVADALVAGELDRHMLEQAIQAGEIDPSVADVAMGLAGQMMQQREAEQGLGAI